MPEQTEATNRLRESVDHLTDVVAGERQARRLGIAITIVAAGVVVLALAAGLLVLARQARDDRATRDAGRIAACNSYNADTADKVNRILLTLAADSRDPEAALETVRPLLLEHRRCDPEGIEFYFDDDPGTEAFEPVEIP